LQGKDKSGELYGEQPLKGNNNAVSKTCEHPFPPSPFARGIEGEGKSIEATSPFYQAL
jgi:hypothetical protein